MKNIEIKNFNGKQFTKLTIKVDEKLMEENNIDYFFKKTKNGVTFYKPNREPFAYLSTREHQAFFVTATPCEGSTRYMFSTTDRTRKDLNIDGLGFGEERELAEVARSVFHTS